ncbi:sensor histidine kinase [Leucobacter salsicius]|uniref:sensor histidine kinase n=1 Tax=Leucobacter salsicius TaxID=664638 RepID=UPI00034D8A5E|nr:ATP-binding protein [Leucobacter salsicius]
MLDDHGLVAAIRARLGDTSDLDFRISNLGVLPAAVDLAALRIIQEAITNVRRHAQATQCIVAIDRVDGVNDIDGALQITVIDDGVGVHLASPSGMGMRSIRDRANELGGEAEFDSPAGGGTRLRVWLPLGSIQEGTT